MITERYWQNADIRKKILITTWQFVFSLPNTHQPQHPWTIQISSVFLQRFLRPLILLASRRPLTGPNLSLSGICWMGQIVPVEVREAWNIYRPDLLFFSLDSSNGICCLHHSTPPSLIYDPLESSGLLSAEVCPVSLFFWCCCNCSHLHCICSYQAVFTFYSVPFSNL